MANATIGSIVAKLMLNIDNFSSNLSKIQNEIENTGKKLDGLNNLGNGLTSVGKTLTTAVTLPIVGVGTAATKLATDFEYSMSQVKAISGATGDDFKALEDEAINLGASTKYSATTVADSMTEMAKAGWSTQQILDGMSGVLDAAAASGEDLGSVSTIVADAITGFGLAASDSTRVADLLTQAANSGTIGITDLGESFKYIAPVASSLGFSIEEATTAIAAMSTAGIKGSQAGTSLKNMLTNLVKPTDPMAAAMEKLGISVTDSAGNMKSLDDILANLRSSFDGLTEAEKAKYAATLAGKEGMSGMLALLNMEQDAYDDITASMLNSNGVAKETASVMQDNLSSALEQLGGAFESLAIRIGQQLVPIIRKVAEYITAFTEKLAGASEEQIQMGIKIAAVVAAIGPMILIVGKLINLFVTARKAITAVKTGFTLFKAAVGLTTGPILAIVAVIGVLIAAFVNLWKNNEEFRNKITEIWTGIVGMFQNFFAQITERINALGFDFENFSEVLRAIWQGLCDFLAPLFIGVFQYISNTLQTVLDVILGVVDFFISAFKGDWEGAWNAIKDILVAVWNGMVAWLQNIGNTLLSVLNVVLGWLGTSWQECWNGVKTFFVNIWTNIKTWFKATLDNIKTTVVTAFNNMKTSISTTITNIKTTIVNGIEKAVAYIKALPGQAITWGKDFVQGFVDGITAKMKALIDKVKSMADKVRSFLHFTRPDEGPLRDYETWMPDMIAGLSGTLSKAAPNLYKTAEMIAGGLANAFNNEDLQAAMAGAYGSVSIGTSRTPIPSEDTNAVRDTNGGGTIHIEKIEVRDDDDIEELTQGLYNHNDKSLRAMGRRNL